MYRATLFFSDDHNYGWSETFFNSLTSHSGVLNQAKFLATDRKNLNGTGVYLTDIRVSDDEQKRDSSLFQPNLPDQLTSFPSFGAHDIANTCLLHRLEAGPNNRRNLYMRGIPDLFTTGGGNWAPNAQWWANWHAWQQRMFNGNWGVKVANYGPAEVLTLVSQSPTSGALTISTVAAHGYAVGSIINISGARKSPGVNGRHTVQAVPSPTSFTIASNYVFKGFNGPAVAKSVTFSLVAFSSVESERLTHRITGVPFVKHRGRRRAI